MTDILIWADKFFIRYIYFCVPLIAFVLDSTMYAHFLFEAFDTNNNGSVSFEVDSVHNLTLLHMENYVYFG